MPALVNSRVGSSAGTSDALGTSLWFRGGTRKYSRNLLRISADFMGGKYKPVRDLRTAGGHEAGVLSRWASGRGPGVSLPAPPGSLSMGPGASPRGQPTLVSPVPIPGGAETAVQCKNASRRERKGRLLCAPRLSLCPGSRQGGLTPG